MHRGHDGTNADATDHCKMQGKQKAWRQPCMSAGDLSSPNTSRQIEQEVPARLKRVTIADAIAPPEGSHAFKISAIAPPEGSQAFISVAGSTSESGVR